MALAEYFDRAALAAAQAIAGFDPERFRTTLERARVGIAFGDDAVASPEGRALLDMAVRLVARLYPRLALVTNEHGPPTADLAALARRINPRIELTDGGGEITLVVGSNAPPTPGRAFYLGCDRWASSISTDRPRALGMSTNPIGAGAAACLGAGNLFRAVFLSGDHSDHELRVSIAQLISGRATGPELEGLTDHGRSALAGLGAIGNAVVWTLARSPARARLHLVDDQGIELSNLQRYVLTARGDVGTEKVLVAADALAGSGVTAVPHATRWDAFVNAEGFAWDRVLVGVDSVHDRRLLQASLPRWLANGWTQVGELGLSTHRFDDAGPCLCCLYLPRGVVASEDETVARALGLPTDDAHLRRIRDLLYRRLPAPHDLLEEIAAARHLDIMLLDPYAARPLRDLYIEGVCGGGVITLSQHRIPGRELHVPLAHQSALAGILVAAAYLLDVAGVPRAQRELVHLNPMRRFPDEPVREFDKDERGICICTNADFRAVYAAKYPDESAMR